MERKDFKKYVFRCKLAAEPVCVVFNVVNGLYGDLLEEFGIWHDVKKPHEYSYVVDYPLMIKGMGAYTGNNNTYDLKVGDTFTLSIK